MAFSNVTSANALILIFELLASLLSLHQLDGTFCKAHYLLKIWSNAPGAETKRQNFASLRFEALDASDLLETIDVNMDCSLHTGFQPGPIVDSAKLNPYNIKCERVYYGFSRRKQDSYLNI